MKPYPRERGEGRWEERGGKLEKVAGELKEEVVRREIGVNERSFRFERKVRKGRENYTKKC